MPTTQSEANSIVAIAQEYIELEKMKELFIRLDDEIGQHTTNDSLKRSLKMMRNLVAPPLKPAPLWLWLAFYTLVVVHIILVIAVATSFCLLPFFAEWYIAVPLMTFIVFFSTTRIECQLTNLENRMRKRLGLKRIGGFVGFYFLRPVKKALKTSYLSR